MSKKCSMIVAALLSLSASAAYAQNQPDPVPSQTSPQEAAGRGMMGNGQMGGRGGMTGMAADQQAAQDRGIVGIYPTLSADAVGAPARLIVRGVAPYSPAYNAGIERGDQIVAVDDQPIDGKSLSDVVTTIRGEVGSPVKLSLSRQGQSREVSLTRVAPVSEHDGHDMSGRGSSMMRHMRRGE